MTEVAQKQKSDWSLPSCDSSCEFIFNPGSCHTTTTMVEFWKQLKPEHISWIVAQKIFWVATSPLSPDGHINVSPKGVAGTFHVINERKVWYEDLSGSGMHIWMAPCTECSQHTQGIETISHIRENGRITIMFNAFEGAPRIVRLFGKGEFNSN